MYFSKGKTNILSISPNEKKHGESVAQPSAHLQGECVLYFMSCRCTHGLQEKNRALTGVTVLHPHAIKAQQ